MKKLNAKQRRKQLKAAPAIADDQIDTSEVPELTVDQMARATRGRLHRPVKRPVTLRLDADVIAWLKKDGPGYQTRANRILRTEMLRSGQHKPKREGSLADFLLASPLRGSGIEIKPLRGCLRKVDL